MFFFCTTSVEEALNPKPRPVYWYPDMLPSHPNLSLISEDPELKSCTTKSPSAPEPVTFLKFQFKIKPFLFNMSFLVEFVSNGERLS